MSDSFLFLDYGEQLVKRYRASGLTRKEFAERSESVLDHQYSRVNQLAMYLAC